MRAARETAPVDADFRHRRRAAAATAGILPGGRFGRQSLRFVVDVAVHRIAILIPQ